MGRLAGVGKWGLNQEHLQWASEFGRTTAATLLTDHFKFQQGGFPSWSFLQSQTDGRLSNKQEMALLKSTAQKGSPFFVLLQQQFIANHSFLNVPHYSG